MKKVKRGELLGLSGRPFQVPARDEQDNVIWKDETRGIPEFTTATVDSILIAIILGILPQLLTRQDSIHATRLYNQIKGSANDNLVLIEDAEWDWVMSKLANDNIGPKIFGVNLYVIEERLKELAKKED